MEHSGQPAFAGVILDQAVGILLDYAIPVDLQGKIQVGSRVIVPLGIHNKKTKGTVWEKKTKAQIPNPSSVKEIAEVTIEPPVLTPDLFLLANWMATYYATPLYQVLQTILPKHVRTHKQRQTEDLFSSLLEPKVLLSLADDLHKKKPVQANVLRILAEENKPLSFSFLSDRAGIKTKAPLEALCKRQILHVEKSFSGLQDPLQAEYFLSKPKSLSLEQQKAFDSIATSLDRNLFTTHLLHGVTGSGKTEIYLQAIEKALEQNKGVIFLVPEIALASQTIERVKSRFAERIAVLHHRLSEGEKKEGWHQMYTGQAKIIIGARSAIFCPVPNLGLIIVDEEQEDAYKQTGNFPCYHARDVAVMRAKFAQAVCILGSATPSLESYHNALLGKYQLLTLQGRPDNACLPHVHIVDMKEEGARQKRMPVFSSPLLSAIEKRLSLGEQTLLLLNRRGYHTCQVCKQCSTPSKCPHCEACLTFHLEKNRLMCHLCGYDSPPLRVCSSCQSEATMQFKGFGTELVEKALYRLFPDARILRMDADTTTRKNSHEQIYKTFRAGKADILVGTQMIAKGLHFPSVTLVGILHADSALQIPDFRSSESLFQLITQAAGRAGRGEIHGEVFIQSFLPSQTALVHAANQDFLSFFHEEIETRKLFMNPPFCHIIKLSFSGEQESETYNKAKEAHSFLVHRLSSSFHLFPVVPAGHAKKEGHYYFQFIIKTSKAAQASPFLLALFQKHKQQKVRLSIDVDPTSTFF